MEMFNNVKRATAEDILTALQFVSNVIGIPIKNLENDLIGSTVLTLLGKKKDSGDIDIAVDDTYMSIINRKMTDACGMGMYNDGSKIGSYPVPVEDGVVQVDFMFVKNKEWAKWVYYSSEGIDSKYKGAVRNILLFTALAYSQEPGKDFVIREKGRAVVRASKSIKMGSGMERMFKMATVTPRSGKYSVGLKHVMPYDIEDHLKTIGIKIKFSSERDLTDNPDDVARHIFGQRVKGKDLMTAENVIRHIHQMKNADEVISACKIELMKLDMTVPNEL